MPSTSTSGAGENAPKYGIAVVTHAAGTNQPSIVLGLRNSSGSYVRTNKNAIATIATPTADSSSVVAVGSPGNSGTDAPPSSAIAMPMKQNRRVRRISSRSSASSGEPTVVEPVDSGGDGMGRGRVV